jgi:hypothetical protein
MDWSGFFSSLYEKVFPGLDFLCVSLISVKRMNSFAWSVATVYAFSPQRQQRESAFQERKPHYFVSRLSVQNLQGNTFWIATKSLTMAVVKLFQLTLLPRSLRENRERESNLRQAGYKPFLLPLHPVYSYKFVSDPFFPSLQGYPVCQIRYPSPS